MKFLVLTVCFLLCFAASKSSGLDTQEVKNDKKPEFCGEYQCPHFTILKKYNGYELRHYNASVWVTVKIPVMEGNFWEDQRYQTQSFHTLLKYIQGDNDRNITVAMTSPVLTTHMKESVIMGFMLPREFSQRPPVPKDPNVSIYRSSGGSVFVRSFGGFAHGIFDSINRYKPNLVSLAMDLSRDGQSFDTSVFYTAAYNGPKEVFNRHNEVWINQQ